MKLNELLDEAKKLDASDEADIKSAGDYAAEKAKNRGDGPKIQQRARERAEEDRRDTLMRSGTNHKQMKKDAAEEDRAEKKSKK